MDELPQSSHDSQHTYQSQHSHSQYHQSPSSHNYQQQANDNNNYQSSHTNNYNTSHQHHSNQNNNQFHIQLNQENNESKYQNNQVRSTSVYSNQSSNTRYQRQNQSLQSYQSQPQQPQYSSQHNYDPYDYTDEKSVALSTVAPERQRYIIPPRPQFLDDFPKSHAHKIQLTVNAISATPTICGILYRYNVRFHAHSNDINDADIPENNRLRRGNIIRNELFQKIRGIYGKFDFDNTVIYCDKKVTQPNKFQYELNTDDEKGNIIYGTVRIEYNAELIFNNEKKIKEEFSHEYISQIVHVVHRNIMRKNGYVTFGRSHYIDPDKIYSLNIRDHDY
eukprot:507122_1